MSLMSYMGFKDNLHAVVCLAKNAVGPTATRPDDIHTLYSGKTVEINNTDAEGRLVLSDGVVYASKDLCADIILDMATLTGAQYHAAVMTNSEHRGGCLCACWLQQWRPGPSSGLLPRTALWRVYLRCG
ncbi:probable aminopeptidase NPEPL1 [Hypomesus transpacificus]|uniref:probable aminopeptidase NPEPL1 n=1 Tax=Hypomesus transpacificus TaxID=137520 RepID=UPI001F077405|nr:probable aminopeptidase NPEPL1 [Hypomesus transpacificus]